MKQLICLFSGLFLLISVATATAQQEAPVIHADVLSFDFGIIAEDGGVASHTFVVKNTGSAPLVITRVTASCGCTTPEWTQSPIAAGKEGEVKVTYNPKGRPGPFTKTIYIYSNGSSRPYLLTIQGTVTPKRPQPVFSYPYTIGDLKMQTKTLLYSAVRPQEILGEKIQVQNAGKQPVTIQIGEYPEFLTVEASPSTLKSAQTGEINVLLNAGAVQKRGRMTTLIPFTVTTPDGQKAKGTFRISANIIEDFGQWTAEQYAQAPSIGLESTWIDFGNIKDTGAKQTRSLKITNQGKSTLTIRSISSDDPRITISGRSRNIKPGATATFKVTIRPKDIRTNLESLINIVCNDPNSPVRLIKVVAKQ